MKAMEDSEELASTMVSIGNHVGRQTMAVISDMSQPLGYAIGNALEVKEAIDTLKGEGPEDLTELSLTLGSHMVYLAKKAKTLEEARELLKQAIQNGSALETFKIFLSAQGGDASVIDHPEKLPQAPYTFELKSRDSGYISAMVADEIGIAAMLLGAGRATKDSEIDLAVGLVLRKKIGDYVNQGESLVTIYSNSENIENVKEKLYENIMINKEKVDKPTLIYKKILA